jgi:hypothetical protein
MSEDENTNLPGLNLDGMYPANNDSYASLYKESDENTSSTDQKDEQSEDEVFYTFQQDVSKMWNKKDYFYKLDRMCRDKILEDFEKKIRNEDCVTEDAFYSSLSAVPSSDINTLREDSYIKTRLECKKMRELNYEFLEICAQNCKEIEKYIQKYRSSTDKDEKIALKGIIKQKKRLDVLYNKVRNGVSELVLRAEECYIFMDSVWSAVFRKSLELATTEMSSQDCN